METLRERGFGDRAHRQGNTTPVTLSTRLVQLLMGDMAAAVASTAAGAAWGVGESIPFGIEEQEDVSALCVVLLFVPS